MNQFDYFVDKARQAADTAAKKTGELVELSKLKLSLSQMRGDIDKAYRRLGKSVYETHCTGLQDDGYRLAVCEELNRLHEKQKRLEQKIAALKKIVVCPCCGSENPIASAYCSHCGAKIPGDAPKKENSADAPSANEEDSAALQPDDILPSEEDGASDRL